MFLHGMKTLMARDLQGFLGPHTVNCWATLLFWEQGIVCVVIHVCLHVCWKQAVEICEKKNCHAPLTNCGTCNSCRVRLKKTTGVAIYLRFVFVSACMLKNIFPGFSFPLSVSPSRMFNNSQTAQVRSGSAGGVPADNIFIQSSQNDQESHGIQERRTRTLSVISGAEALYATYVCMANHFTL